MLPDRLTTKEQNRMARAEREHYWDHRDYPTEDPESADDE